MDRDPLITALAQSASDATKGFLVLSAIGLLVWWPWVKTTL